MSVRYVYWRQDEDWIGYFEEYPDYWTQGTSLEDLEEHLKDLLRDLSSEIIPETRRVAELYIG